MRTTVVSRLRRDFTQRTVLGPGPATRRGQARIYGEVEFEPWIARRSPTLIEGEKDFARFSSHFLGHSPRSIKDRSYTAPSSVNFDEAVLWLGRTYGYIEV